MPIIFRQTGTAAVAAGVLIHLNFQSVNLLSSISVPLRLFVPGLDDNMVPRYKHHSYCPIMVT